MSIKTNYLLVEGSHAGVKAIVRDTNSDIVVPTSMSWILRDSLGSIVGSGTPSALSSETQIIFTPSETIVNSGEVKGNLVRTLDIDSRFTSTVFGANAIRKETFELTLVNNPY